MQGRSNPEVYSKKGPVFATAIIAGTMAVKQTSNLIPFCHPLHIEKCEFSFRLEPVSSSSSVSSLPSSSSSPSNAEAAHLYIECTVGISGKTGVEMEALTGASVAALTVYDMCKAASHNMVIEDTRLVFKTGGKSGAVNALLHDR